MGERKVPTEPGWWWRNDGADGDRVVEVFRDNAGALSRWAYRSHVPVADDGCWIAHVLTFAEADALRERAERAEEERDSAQEEASSARRALQHEQDHVGGLWSRIEALEASLARYREAVGRLRLVLESCRSALVRGDEDHDGLACDVVSTLDVTTDEAIQGYDEPPAGDAALLAKANAAIGAQLDAANAELSEARAELAAERGEAEGALPGWELAPRPEATDHDLMWARCEWKRDAEPYRYVGGIGPIVGGFMLGLTRDRFRVYDANGIIISVRRDGPGIRAAMRAAEAEARRLGLLVDDGEQPKPGGGA